MLDALADHEQLALERRVALARNRRRGQSGTAADEDLPEHRLDRNRARTERAVVGRHLAPADEALPFLRDDPLEQLDDRRTAVGVVRQENQPGAVRARFRQLPAEPAGFLAQEAVRHLNQDAGAVAGVDFTAAGTAVFEVDEHLQGLPDDLVRPASLHVRHEPDAAGVALMSRVIQALRGGIVVLMHASFMNEELS